MESVTDSDSYSADYGDLRLEVYLRGHDPERAFEFRVLDKSDAGVLWVGNSADLETAQSSALFEAQTFLNNHIPRAPRWRRAASYQDR